LDVYAKNRVYIGWCKRLFTVIERLLFLLKIHTLFKCSRCMWFCFILHVLQLYRYTITLNSPSAQTSCVYLWVEVLWEMSFMFYSSIGIQSLWIHLVLRLPVYTYELRFFEKCFECLNITCLDFHDWVVDSLLKWCLTPWAQWKKCYVVCPTIMFI